MAKIYNLHTPHSFDKETLKIKNDLFGSMWELFLHIGFFWRNGKSLGMEKNPAIEDSIKSQLMDFMNNRIQEDPSYYNEYKNAQNVIAHLIKEHGKKGAYKTLFTANIDPNAPPKTPLERARIKVSNEFVLFQLAVGGFKAFGAKNYLGYFGGANVKGKPPYRTYKD